MQVRRYETSKLNIHEIRKQFQLELKNRFSCLSMEDEDHGSRYDVKGEVAHDNGVEKMWTNMRQTYCERARGLLGYRIRKRKSCISPGAGKILGK